jgi:hypothetical protein
MRRILMASVLVALLAAVAVPAAAQVPGPGGPYNSAFTIQNLESSTATCTFSLYNSSGAESYASSSFTISGSNSYFVYVGSLSVSPGQYSAVISCDREVAAVANMSDPSRSASYSGIRSSEVDTLLYAPGVYRAYYGNTSNIVVQNTTGASVNVTVRLYQAGSSTPVATQGPRSVPAYAATSFDQGTLPSTGIYSAQIEATGNIAAVVNIWNSSGQFYSYNPFAGGSEDAYVPVLMNNYYGNNTALTVQNLASSSTSVTVRYSNGTNRTRTIAGNSSALFYTPSDGLPSNWLGSARIDGVSGANIVALVNESGPLNRAASYSGFSAGTYTANAPIVLRNYYGYSTSITCQNVGTASTTITVNYSNGASEARTVAANNTALFFQPSTPGLPNGFNGSAVITAGRHIVCVVNQNQLSNTNSQDKLLAYNAIQQ